MDKNDNGSNEIEIIIGDDSILDISEVGDCLNDLRPKDSEKNRKQVIVPIAKTSVKKEESKKKVKSEKKVKKIKSDKKSEG